MLSIYQIILLFGGTLLLWLAIGYVAATIRYRSWPVLLWSVFFFISALRMLAQAVDLWMNHYVVWYILSSIALMAVLTFTLKYRGWRLLQEHGIGGKQLLLFWQK